MWGGETHAGLMLLKKLVRLGCITQSSLVEIINQRFSLKYQMFPLMKAAASCRNVWYFKENLWLVISAREPCRAYVFPTDRWKN